MEIAYTEEQQALKSELRAYYQNLLTPEVEQAVGPGGRCRARRAQGGQADGERRVARHRLAEGMGRPGALGHRAVHLLRRVHAQRGARSHAHHQHGRPHDHEFRHAGAKGVLPPQDPRRGDLLLHRLHRAQLGDGPRLAHHPGRARRRRVRHQRLQDLHQPRRRRRLRLAGHPDRPQRREAQGHLHVRRADGHAGDPGGPDEAARGPQHQLHLLRGRARPGHQPGGRGEPGLDPHHQPAQPRTGHVVLARDRRAGADRRAGLGPVHQAPRRPPCGRPGVGPGAPRPGARRARVPAPDQLEGGVAGHAGPPRRGRRLDHQGLRHRVLPARLSSAHGDPGAGRLPHRAGHRPRSSPAASRCTPAP